jgi:hypothetical protein
MVNNTELVLGLKNTLSGALSEYTGGNRNEKILRDNGVRFSHGIGNENRGHGSESGPHVCQYV